MRIKAPQDAIIKSAEDAGVRVTCEHDKGNFYRVRLFPIGDTFRRTSASVFHEGRRVNAVCWHGHLEFMRLLYGYAPDAVIHTSMATYRSLTELMDRCYDSYYRNVGSQIYPREYGECCLCH